jgi:hypothetical protein
MNKYNYKLTEENIFTDVIEKTIQITRSNTKKQIDIWEVRTILANMQSRLPDSQIIVRGMNAQHLFTFKGYTTDLNIQDFEEYYLNKVADSEKFERLSFLQLTVKSPRYSKEEKVILKSKIKSKKLKI